MMWLWHKIKTIYKMLSPGFFDSRPWGYYTVLDSGAGYLVKTIVVYPNKRLSYQKHDMRSEQWTILRGQATVIINDDEMRGTTGSFFTIPVGAKHRIQNPSNKENLVFLEAQLGDVLLESDIIRFRDDYGRQ